ncbi:hypothetical protein B0J11DRAFT_433712 [Dendryphion nanum]|uniref:Uncharacterized protein n=1 Tax=Dendryphion nanum TaxID=256645 RepID=A0A9P9DT82_9PLEO|nr:hypothetical protein B0J11DRAFT_433712 [Dendryphion nanum]
MRPSSLLPTVLLSILQLPSLTTALTTNANFTGIGHIIVLQSDDWTKASTTRNLVGCLSANGSFINPNDTRSCGTFSRLGEYPWTLSTKQGNCTFNDQTTERNTDSHYGRSDHAWICRGGWTADVYDELYTIDGFPHVFLCFGDIACYYDTKRVPGPGEALPLWQFRWGSQQRGITPGHVQVMLWWKKIGELPKRGGDGGLDVAPGPRVRVGEGVQVKLGGRGL